jgi:phage baseplate assembly protein W
MPTRNLSVEDGTLNKRSIVTTRTSDYSDIDATFELRTNGDVYRKIDAAAVKQSVKNIVMTNHYEKPFDMFFGGNVQRYLFELAEDDDSSRVEDMVIRAIQNREPRALVREVYADLSPDSNSLNVRIVFQVVNTGEVVSFQTDIIKVR